jgi:hypothetical protein
MSLESGIDLASRSPEWDVFQQIEHRIRIDVVCRDASESRGHLGEGLPSGDLVDRDEHELSVARVVGQLVAKADHPVAVDGVAHRVRATFGAMDPSSVVAGNGSGKHHR